MNMKKNWNYLTAIAGLALIAFISLLSYIGLVYLDIYKLQKSSQSDPDVSTYSYHCAFISDSSDTFWSSVFEAAKEQGLEYGIYVEQFGQDLFLSYSTDELLKMAIAAKVDAIFVEPTSEFSNTYLLNKAIDAGIAVETLYRDEIKVNRFNNTGINSFSLGYDYGTLALKYAADDADSFIVIFDEDENISERRLLISGIGKALSEEGDNAKLDSLLLKESNSFEAEDELRQFIKESGESTDVIICTTLQQTQYVSQLAIDLNVVGDFTIIGYYQNTAVLEALKNGVISANIVVDSSMLGQKAIDNLAEYLKYGRTSDYTQINSYILDSNDATKLLQQEGEPDHEN